MEGGVGNSAVPNPQMTLSISRDGKTWGPERTRGVGRVGEYNRRIVWRKNGRASRFTVFNFVLSEAVKPAVLKLEAV